MPTGPLYVHQMGKTEHVLVEEMPADCPPDQRTEVETTIRFVAMPSDVKLFNDGERASLLHSFKKILVDIDLLFEKSNADHVDRARQQMKYVQSFNVKPVIDETMNQPLRPRTSMRQPLLQFGSSRSSSLAPGQHVIAAQQAAQLPIPDPHLLVATAPEMGVGLITSTPHSHSSSDSVVDITHARTQSLQTLQSFTSLTGPGQQFFDNRSVLVSPFGDTHHGVSCCQFSVLIWFVALCCFFCFDLLISFFFFFSFVFLITFFFLFSLVSNSSYDCIAGSSYTT